MKARSSNLDDALPALATLSAQAPQTIPVKLNNGTATFEGTVRGSLDDPEIAGQLVMTGFSAEGHPFDRLTSDFVLKQSGLHVRRVALTRDSMQVDGQGELGLSDWKALATSAVSATMNLRGARLEKLLAEAAISLPLSGAAAATVKLGGTYGDPRADVNVEVDQIVAYEEQVDHLRAAVHAVAGSVQITSGRLELGAAQAQFKGGYDYDPRDARSGRVQVELDARGFNLSQFEHIRKMRPGLAGPFTGQTKLTGTIGKAGFDLSGLTAQLALRNVVLDRQPFGSLTLTAETKAGELNVRATTDLHGSRIDASGQWRLQGDYPGAARVEFSKVTLAMLQDLQADVAALDSGAERVPPGPLPFEGLVQGQGTLTVALKRPETMRADVTINTVQVNPKPGQQFRLDARPEDLVLRNTRPVEFQVTPQAVRVRSAQFAAKDTDIQVSGTAPLDSKTPLNLTATGSLSLAVLQILNPDLLAQGNASLDARIRGTRADPQVTGQLQLKNASLYLSDLPNGVTNANGVILFDRSRATIQQLTAETGGGKLSFSGFVGFGGSVLVYRLQANADQVRVRLPQDVSISFNSLLNLTGTSESSVLSGSLTVNRVNFNPRTDLAQLLAQSTKPTPASAAPSEYLRGMQLDVRVESGPGLQVQTSLARDIQAEAELRLRGTPVRPVLLGDVSVSEGEVQFFGSRYTINHGEVRFLNPVKIEPLFDMDLETKARGITVNITFSGTLSKMNVAYRSDPPLQSTEIIALLAVGRTPTLTSGTPAATTDTQSSFLQSSAGSILGQALSSQVSSRLQRFFGVSRLKIDPQLVGVDNIPQARLTLEQQVSKDVTLTYITNLSRTQEQIVQVQWDLSREWSVVAIRDENGIFGIDFQYRKRFK